MKLVKLHNGKLPLKLNIAVLKYKIKLDIVKEFKLILTFLNKKIFYKIASWGQFHADALRKQNEILFWCTEFGKQQTNFIKSLNV